MAKECVKRKNGTHTHAQKSGGSRRVEEREREREIERAIESIGKQKEETKRASSRITSFLFLR